MDVPPPTFCPPCRFQRRLAFRNERNFYKRECGLCNKTVISIFSPGRNLKIFCSKCYWGDGWDPGEFYLDYDPDKNFFVQLKELQEKTPFMEKVIDYSTNVNSDYVNHAGSCKNCYLIFTADYCENVYYSSTLAHVRDSSDLIMGYESELTYGCIGGSGSSSCFFSSNCSKSVHVWYSLRCTGCTDCFGCVNLKNKSNCIFNEQYTKEEYKKKIAEMNLDKHSGHAKIREHIYDFWKKFPNKYVHCRMNHNSTGEYVVLSKNAKQCYQVAQAEDCAYCQFITLPTVKDTYDFTDWGHGVERCIETTNSGEGSYEVNYCASVWGNVRNIEYSMFVINSSNCFGCVNLRKKEYCILNKQYTKEEYFALREKIVTDLEENPYIDKKGRIFKYGEFFPYDISPFSYNESFAQQYFPLLKEEIEEKGFKYVEPKKPDYKETIQIEEIPDSINDIQDDFIKEILKCECEKFYRIVVGELQLLKRLGIPVPRECPDCRHMSRIRRLNSYLLYDRKCDKCGSDIKTSFAPDRPEIIYCESCYQQEVM